MKIRSEMTAGELIVATVQLVAAAATLLLAYFAWAQLRATSNMFRDENRPWLDVEVVGLPADHAAAPQTTFKLTAIPGRSPARHVICFLWESEGGMWGGSINLPSSVLLPNTSMQSASFTTSPQMESLKLECRYGMVQESEFRTVKTFKREGYVYVESPLLTSFE
jgi:hypothetical protein